MSSQASVSSKHHHRRFLPFGGTKAERSPHRNSLGDIMKPALRRKPGASKHTQTPVWPLTKPNHKSTLKSLSAMQHRDVYGNLITDPDLSNPTRHRNESPLQTIRSFQYTIDKAYDTRRRVPHQPSRASLVRNGGRGGSISPVATFGSQPYLEYRNNRLDFVSASDADLDVSDLIPHHPHYYQRSHSRLRIPINSDSSSSSGPSLLPSQSSFARIPRASSPRVLSSIATPSPQPTDDISSIMKYSEENSPVQSSAATTGGTSSSGSHHLTPPVGPLQGLAVTMPATAPPGSAPQPPAHSKSTTEYDEYEDDDEDDDEDDENLNDRKDNKGTRGMFRRWFS